MDHFARQTAAPTRPPRRRRNAPRPLVLDPAWRSDPIPPAPLQGGWMEAAIAAETRVMTPGGPCPAGRLAPGAKLLTLDAGALPLLWAGRRSLTAAQIAARPDLGPVEIAPHAFDGGQPRETLRLSPRAGLHLILPDGPEGGVLAPAGALVGMPGIRRAPARGVTYVQLFLEVHGLVGTEGLAVETLHPARLRPVAADRGPWSALLGLRPELEHGAWLYGPAVRPRAEPPP
jgi:hypothetical protein